MCRKIKSGLRCCFPCCSKPEDSTDDLKGERKPLIQPVDDDRDGKQKKPQYGTDRSESSTPAANQQTSDDSAGPSEQQEPKKDEDLESQQQQKKLTFTKFDITEIDSIFEDIKNTLNPFVENREKVEKAEEDFKKAVKSLQKMSPKASFSEYVQALKTNLKKENIFIKIKKGVVVFGGEVEKAYHVLPDIKSAIEDIIEAGKGLKIMLPSIFRANEDCLERCSNLEVTNILRREFTGVWDVVKVWRYWKAFSDNVKKLRQAPDMVREFYSEIRNIIMELFDAFADQEEKERMNEEMPVEEDKEKQPKGKGKKKKGNEGKAKQASGEGNEDEPEKEKNDSKENKGEQDAKETKQNGKKENRDKDGPEKKADKADKDKQKEFHKELAVKNIGIPDIDRIFEDFVKAVNPFVTSREQLQTARESFETTMAAIANLEVGKALREYLQELKDKAKKGDIHIYIDVSDSEIKVKSVSGIPPPKEYRNAVKTLNDMKKAAADLLKLEPDVQRGVVAVIHDVTQLNPASDFRKIIKIRELPKLPGKITAFNDNRKTVQQAPTAIKESVVYVKELLSDIKEFFSDKVEKPEENGPNEPTGSKNSEESSTATKESCDEHKIKDPNSNTEDQGAVGGELAQSDEQYEDARSGRSDSPSVQVAGLTKSDDAQAKAQVV